MSPIMTEQEKTEIRKIIREEIEAKLTGKPVLTVLRDSKESSIKDFKIPRVINIETVSPAY
jgi:hypothetical protein